MRWELVVSMSVVLGSMAGEAAAAPAALEGFEARTFDDGAGHTLPYRLFVPRGIDPGRKVALVLFLHGSGGRGTDNGHQLTDQAAPLVFVKPENQARWPLVMVAPQCPPDQQWVAMPWGAPSGKAKRPAEPTWPLAAALALVDKLVAELPAVDRNNLFVTGISMGGFGTFDAAARQPEKWRAAVPICGGYDDDQVAPLARVRLWAFHAEDDRAVPVARSRDIIAALRKLGGAPRYTEYPASARYGHFSWNPAYADPALLPWMFDERAAPPPAPASGATEPPPRAPEVPAPMSSSAPAHRRGCTCAVAVASTDPPAAIAVALVASLALVGLALLAVRSRRRT